MKLGLEDTPKALSVNHLFISELYDMEFIVYETKEGIVAIPMHVNDTAVVY